MCIRLTFSIGMVLLTSIFRSCKDDEQQETTEIEASFEVQEMVGAIATTRIVPAVTALKTQVDVLHTEVTTFLTTPTTTNLETAQHAWEDAAKAYAAIYTYNIGVPKSRFMHELLYNWPAFTVAIERTIDEETTPIDVAQLSTKAKGLTGIEYLLFGDQEVTNAEVVSLFETQARRVLYLEAITAALQEEANRLLSIWAATGEDYATTLQNNTETGLQGSVNMLFNGAFNVVETIKKAKLGKPAGLESATATNIELLEAYRSETSLALLEANLKSVEQLYFNPDGLGVSDYVQAITKDEVINTRIRTHFEHINEALAVLQNPLYFAIDQEKEVVATLYTHITTLSMLLHTDVASTLSIIITPTDNDGD